MLGSLIVTLCQYTEILQTIHNGHLLIKDQSPWILKIFLNFYHFDLFTEFFFLVKYFRTILVLSGKQEKFHKL